MEAHEIKAALDRFTYKPNWFFYLYRHPSEGLWLRIYAEVIDAYTGKLTSLGINSAIPPVHDDEAFYDWLVWRLERIESHECREWAKVDGKALYDPHAEITDQLIPLYQ